MNTEKATHSSSLRTNKKLKKHLSLERGVASFLVEKGGELFLRGGDSANKIERYGIAQFGKACVLMSGTIPTRNSSSYLQINIENSKAITDCM